MSLSISELCNKYHISSDTVRYYEKIDILPKIPRNDNGRRYFDEDVEEWVEMVVCLRKSGVSIKTLQEYVKLVRLGDSTLSKRQILLNKQEEELLNKREELDHSIGKLREKINLYKTGEIKNHKSIFKKKN